MPFPIDHAHVITGITDAPPTGGVGPTRWNDPHSGLEILRTTTDRSNATTSFADVADLTFSIAANEVVSFSFHLMILSSASTVGVQLAVNGPASPTAVNVMAEIYTTATGTVVVPQTAYDTTTGQPTAGVATRVPAYVYGTIENGATAGTVALRLRAEVSGTVTVVRGSWGEVWHL